MVAHVLRLRLDLLVGAFRGDARRVARAVALLVLLVAAIVLVFLAAARLRAVDVDVAHTVTVVAGSALTLGSFMAALVGGFDDQLDPRRFAVFGVSAGATGWTVLLASVLSAPVLALIAVGVAVGGLWSAQGASDLVVAVSTVLGVVTCLLAAKIALAVGSLVLRERRSRELSGVLLVGVLVVVVPIVVFFVSLEWGDGVPPALRAVVDILAVSPLGAAWAAPGASLSGEASAPLVIAVATVMALLALWHWLVRRLLTTTERPVTVRERVGLGWFAVMPGTAAGGIAARSLVYWLRDARYLVNMAIVPIVAVVVVVPLLLVGVPGEYVALLPAPLLALFLGWLPHNDLAYDSTALWMHVAGAVRGTSDRIGRLVPITLIGVAALAVAIPVSVSLHGRWSMLPAMVGVCASLFLCGLGLSSISSVLTPYAASRPGDGAFEQPQRTGGGLSQGVVLIGALALSAPAFWWAWLALTGDVDQAWTAAWGGTAIGLLVAVVGLVIGGAVFDRRGSRLMEFVEST